MIVEDMLSKQLCIFRHVSTSQAHCIAPDFLNKEQILTLKTVTEIFSGCIKAYAFFTTATNFGRDSERLVCKIRIEEMRLLVWGREWGVTEGKLEAHLQAESKAGNELLRPLATQILTQLLQTITDFKKLQEKYGLKEENVGLEGKKDGTKYEDTGVRGLRNEFQLRAKWMYVKLFHYLILAKGAGGGFDSHISVVSKIFRS